MKILKEQASKDGWSILERNREAVRNQLQDSPVLTIHPKVKTYRDKGQFEPRCILNRTALKKVFSKDAENYEVDFGNKARYHVEKDEETGESFVGIRREVIFAEAEGAAQEEQKMARVSVSPNTGLFESDWLAKMIFHMHEGLDTMDKNTVYHFLLQPCSVNSNQKENHYLTGWEMHLIKTEPAEELVLVTDVTQN